MIYIISIFLTATLLLAPGISGIAAVFNYGMKSNWHIISVVCAIIMASIWLWVGMESDHFFILLSMAYFLMAVGIIKRKCDNL